MESLNLPTYSFKIKLINGRNNIFDIIRKKYVVLTPEEWVRQNVVMYLSEEKHFPLSLMSVESSFSLYNTTKRTDILVYNNTGNPLMMVECKASKVKIDSSVFDQILRYNLSYKLNYIIVTNGLNHFCCKIDHENNTSVFLPEIPPYSEINTM